jgi:uncharacterized membrane protein
MPSNHLKDHIAIIAKHEEEFLGARATPEHVADLLGAFVGSLGFAGIHCLVQHLDIDKHPGMGVLPQFDQASFLLLDTVVAVEAIFLASFIGMSKAA